MVTVGIIHGKTLRPHYSLASQVDEHKGVRALLRGHTDHVNAIKFFPQATSRPPIIISGSVDKTVRVWQAQFESYTNFDLKVTLDSHAGSVNCLAVGTGTDLIASGSADATVKVWRLTVSNQGLITELIQTIPSKPRLFPLTLAIHSLATEDDLVLAIAGTSSIVQVFVASKEKVFDQQAILTGHESWIRSLAITQETGTSNGDLMLASASQDKYIRLWRITKFKENVPSDEDSLIEAFEQSLSNKAHKLAVSHCLYTITFEALLLGHEDWIYSIAWHQDNDHIQLLSTSADNSLAIWQPEESSGIWVCTTRLGEISSQKGSTTATGSTGGFWIGLWSPSGMSLASLGRTGAWRLWSYDLDHSRWAQNTGISGHTKSVTDMAWPKDGSYLLSIGSDQTTRLHAAWKQGQQRSWHEMSRPQIHGYDLNCIDSINQSSFISGADEKLLRVFDEPQATADLLHHLCGVKFDAQQSLPDTANIPVLGLSNKAVESAVEEQPPYGGNDTTELLVSGMSELHTRISDSYRPPFEDQLARHTLWPEKEKLYGHGYEISAVAASHDGTLVATSCKASSLEHSVIRIYRTADWREIKPSLTAHSLTVYSLCFAGDDQYLLSVGRDRKWAVFERQMDSPEKYLLKYSNPKGHSRMILSASWSPLEAGRVFATAGRDKMIRMWKLNEKDFDCIATIALDSPITAVDICSQIYSGATFVACGTEVGEIILYTVQISDWTTRHSSKLEDS